MASRVVLVHGWSAHSDSMLKVRDFLRANDFGVSDVWLSEYISLNDDVRVEDVVKRMHRVLRLEADRLGSPFDMIVHSTGGLVAREWITQLRERGDPCPVKRLIMLAPANFGSRLASTGKSMIGRVVKGWDNWLQTGEQMLRELELASEYTWKLAQRDLVAPGGGPSPYGQGKVWPFVICGTRGFTSGLQQIANESGSDSTVRPSAANLNVVGLTMDFTANTEAPDVKVWKSREGAERIPFAVLPDRSHGTILEPAFDVGSTTSAHLGEMILQALNCDTDKKYSEIADAWDQVSEDTAAIGLNPGTLGATFKANPPSPEDLHQYLQVVVLVRDDQGHRVNDYFLEFFCPQVAGDQDSVFFHQNVLDDVHKNTTDSSLRCLFIDRTDLFHRFYDGVRKQVALSISAAAPGRDVRYFDSTKEGAKGHVVVHDIDKDARDDLPGRLRRNRTHLVEIVIPRQPTDKVFELVP